MFTSSSVYSFGEIITTSGNVPNTIYLIVLISSIRSIFIIIAIFFVRRMPSCFPFPLPLRVQSVSPMGCSIGCADPSPFLNVTGRMFLTGFSSGRVASLALNFLCLERRLKTYFYIVGWCRDYLNSSSLNLSEFLPIPLQ